MIRTTLRTGIMASYRSYITSPFSDAVVECMRRLYPESLADKSFDNTGLLLEAPWNRKRQLKNSALLTIDLTQAVAAEAIERGDSIIIAYHPIIFRGLKSLTSNNTQQQTLLRLAAEGISVYSPHTAVDAVPGGMADWLCDIVTRSVHENPQVPIKSKQATDDSTGPSSISASDAVIPHSRSTILQNPLPPPGFEGAGAGRLVSFSTPQPLTSIIKRIGTTLGLPRGLPHFPLAIPQDSNVADMEISTVATCPGSGSSILMKDGKPVADLLLTGETSHHDALAAIENGSVVIALFHSNSERGYLHDVMRGKLEEALRLEWGQMIEDLADLPETASSGMANTLNDPSVEVKVSECDKDPYSIVAWPENL
ncbi:NGG1p interacting factor 3 family protein [Coccidioides immitis RMSCC 3703]|uniref:NGG1p interacting factor 3 family protein n=2 Tax=Coccidioides immitis TaxID=5501 RepID=A0A0J8QY20_COCIT|nr:NGG1p interacting factor 3 family protein [Coccidioides immitis RMSCC 2394]KMU76273.1 NGG1p interacting factor 3 family protein [Coccidioides immitis RMSCC 3703]